jgi:hypothetical protein
MPVGVAVGGTGVFVAVGGTGVLVAVGVFVGVFVGLGVVVAVAVLVAVDVAVGGAVGVRVAVGVLVGRGGGLACPTNPDSRASAGASGGATEAAVASNAIPISPASSGRNIVTPSQPWDRPPGRVTAGDQSQHRNPRRRKASDRDHILITLSADCQPAGLDSAADRATGRLRLPKEPTDCA